MSTAPSRPSERTAALKRELWIEIDRRRDELARLCADGLRVPAENLPGDTRTIADYYERILGRAGVHADRVEPRPTTVSLVATLPGREARPRFTFNGHLDHFPADDHALWSFPPYEGEIREGRMIGRGVSDLRGGISDSLFTWS